MRTLERTLLDNVHGKFAVCLANRMLLYPSRAIVATQTAAMTMTIAFCNLLQLVGTSAVELSTTSLVGSNGKITSFTTTGGVHKLKLLLVIGIKV